jgi:argininosuccinate lyase
MPFRDAHHVTGRIVATASKAGVPLHQLPLKDMQAIEPRITAEALSVLAVEASVKSRNSYGGTAPKNVLAQAKAWLKRLEKQRKLG